MKGGKRPLGYTIVEVMIVLAVSGMMFVIAANFINGKQERTAFTQGTNDLVSQLQNVAADVTDGHYSDIPINCTSSVNGTSVSFGAPSGSPGQGANAGCVFWGKLVHFYVHNTAQPQNYEVFSLAAARTTNANPGIAALAPPPNDTLTTQSLVPQGLFIRRMNVYDSAGNDNTTVYNIGFVQSLGTVADPATGVYESGAQTIGLVYTPALSFGSKGDESNIAGIFGGVVQSARAAQLCVTDGTRFAELLIGTPPGAATNSSSNNGNQLSISVQQLGTTNPGAPVC